MDTECVVTRRTKCERCQHEKGVCKHGRCSFCEPIITMEIVMNNPLCLIGCQNCNEDPEVYFNKCYNSRECEFYKHGSICPTCKSCIYCYFNGLCKTCNQRSEHGLMYQCPNCVRYAYSKKNKVSNERQCLACHYSLCKCKKCSNVAIRFGNIKDNRSQP